jgi:hypothetical protein
MWCEDDHTWIVQEDGTVSPSWGYGGTHMEVADPQRCPEPRRNEFGQCWCDDCGGWKTSLGDCLRGLSFSPWEEKEWCRPPAPACLKPAVGGNAWSDRDLPFDDRCWCAWWVRQNGAWRLTFHQGQVSRRWAATYLCLDVHTGEAFDVDRTCDARRAALDDYPAYLRDRWWRTDKGSLIGSWSTMEKNGAGYLINRQLVETWVAVAVELGAATEGMQLALDVDA